MFGWYQIASCFKMILKCFVPVAPYLILKEYHNTCFRVEAFSMKRATTVLIGVKYREKRFTAIDRCFKFGLQQPLNNGMHGII